MGAGKTAAGQALKHLLHRSCFLDGDWCWDMHPFTVTEETKAMVMDSIPHLLSAFLRRSEIDSVIFSWVMHDQSIINELLSCLPLNNVRVVSVSLICSKDTLISRLTKDIHNGIREPDVLERSLQRLPLYQSLDSIKLNTNLLTPEETANAIAML